MAMFYGCLIFLATIILKAECQFQNYLSDAYNLHPNSRSILQSLASQVPGTSATAVADSKFPLPPPPQVLLNALKPASQQGPSPTPNTLQSMLSRFGGALAGNGSAGYSNSVNKPSLPMTTSMKVMATKWATQLGHKAYYEAHGCVDPSTTLHGSQSRLAVVAFMMGCNNYQATEVCEMAQQVYTGGHGASLRTLIELMVGKDVKHMLEECLTPSTFMNGIMANMIPSQQQRQSQRNIVQPANATAKSKSQRQVVDCSSIAQLLMMSSGSEGLLNPETLEQIGVLRNRFFRMTCQENVILGSLPYRLCCPGLVKPPTMEEAMMLRGMGAA